MWCPDTRENVLADSRRVPKHLHDSRNILEVDIFREIRVVVTHQEQVNLEKGLRGGAHQLTDGNTAIVVVGAQVRKDLVRHHLVACFIEGVLLHVHRLAGGLKFELIPLSASDRGVGDGVPLLAPAQTSAPVQTMAAG